MENYEVLDDFASGTYSVVYHGISKRTKQKVAIKKLTQKFESVEQVQQQRDIQTLLQLPHHPNCLKLIEKIYENEAVYLVFDEYDMNLLQFIATVKPKPLQHRNISFKLLQGLFHIHQQSIMHRDISPTNILLKFDQNNIEEMQYSRVVVSDYGLCKNQRLKPHTDYITTRWYRSPEQLLGFQDYDCKIDVFSAGCVLAEMYSGKALFQGKTQIDQLQKINEILGYPEPKGSPKLKQMCERIAKLKLNGSNDYYSFLKARQNIMLSIGCDERLADLLANMLKWDPIERFSCQQCLAHTFFAVM